MKLEKGQTLLCFDKKVNEIIVSESVIQIAEPSRQNGNIVNNDAELCVQNELKFTYAHLITSKKFRGYTPGPPYKGKGTERKEGKGRAGRGRRARKGHRGGKERMERLGG
jgi:hypothetical protein